MRWEPVAEINVIPRISSARVYTATKTATYDLSLVIHKLQTK